MANGTSLPPSWPYVFLPILPLPRSETVNAANSRTLISPAIPPHPSTPVDHWLARFPGRTFLELGAYREAAASARGHARNAMPLI